MISVKAVGLDEANRALERAFGTATAIAAVQLTSKKREDEPDTSAQVLQDLAGGGRDFAYASSDLTGQIAATVARGVQAQINARAQNVDSAAAKVYTAAMKTYREAVVARINSGDWEGGGGDLSPAYAAEKREKHGFTYPIGIATGQLIRELATAGRIKLIRAPGAAGFKLPALTKT